MMIERINEGDLYDRAKIAKDYLMGNHTSAYKFQDATDDEIKSNTTLSELTKIFDKAKADYHVKIDLKANKLQMTFDATKVPTEVVDDFKSGGKYDKYVNSYNQDSHEVEMIFDVEKNVSDRNKDSQTEDESVMVPTPTPYKYNPAKTPEDNDDLIINEDLTMTDVEPYYDGTTGDVGLTTEINGRRYDFRMKDDSPYSVDQMFIKISKIMKFSKGKALAFLKKHAVGTHRTESKLREGNPFKSSFICQGCGKPLDQCTCEVDDEDKVNEDLTVGESLNDSIAVKMSRDDFDRMCRENGILQGLSRSDYIEIRDLFYIGYEDFDAAVNDLWYSDDSYHSRDWYEDLLKKYINSVEKSLNESVTFSDYMLDNNSILHSTSELLKDYKTTTPTKFICPKDEYPLVELSSEDGEHILQCIHCQAQYAYEDDDPETIVDLDNIDESLSKSLNEDNTQLKFDDNEMINDIEVLHMWRPKEVERILIKHGSFKNSDNWIDGLDLPAAYDEIMSTFRDEYSDYDEIDYGVAKVLGLVEESLIKEDTRRDDLLWSVSNRLSYEDWYDDDIKFHVEHHKDGSHWIVADNTLGDDDSRRVTSYIEDILIDRYDMNPRDFEVVKSEYSTEWTILFKDEDSETQTDEDLSEDLTHDEDDALSVVIEKFGTTNTPYQGPTFILPNGLFLNLEGRSHHSEVEKFLVDNGYSEGPYGLTTGSPTLKNLGCIRCDTVKYYVALTNDGPTSEQYNSLLVWLDYLSRFRNQVEIVAPGVQPATYSLESEVDSDEVLDRVRKYYAFGSLNEELSRHGLYIRQPIGEAFSAATATQPSSVGSHKRDSIDLIELGGEDDG